jgi:hypothetical protein
MVRQSDAAAKGPMMTGSFRAFVLPSGLASVSRPWLSITESDKNRLRLLPMPLAIAGEFRNASSSHILTCDKYSALLAECACAFKALVAAVECVLKMHFYRGVQPAVIVMRVDIDSQVPFGALVFAVLAVELDDIISRAKGFEIPYLGYFPPGGRVGAKRSVFVPRYLHPMRTSPKTATVSSSISGGSKREQQRGSGEYLHNQLLLVGV